MRRRVVVAALAAWPLGRAEAHAFLKSAEPAVGSEVRAPPERVAIEFTEAVEPAFCRIEVFDGAGRAVPTGALAAEGGRRLVLALPRLGPGAYAVVWHATSVDTHKTEGRFTFSVLP